MAKYHINKKSGNIAYCNATVKACPHGGEDEHYSEAKDARAAYEKLQAAGLFATASKKSATAKATDAPKQATQASQLSKKVTRNEDGRIDTGYVRPVTAEAAPDSLSKREQSQAVAYAKANKVFAIMEHKMRETPNLSDRESLYNTGGLVSEKTFTYATPSGGIVEATHNATLDMDDGDHSKYYPTIHVTYVYYPDLKSYKAGEASTKGFAELEYDERLRDSGGYLTYDHYDYDSSVRATQRLARSYTDAMDIARLAELRHGQKRISKNTLMQPHYINSPNRDVRVATVSRPELTSELHQEVLESQPDIVLNALAQRSDLTRKSMASLLAKDKYTAETIRAMRWHPSPREMLLQNPALPASIMKKIAKEGTLKDMKALWSNPKLDPEAKATLEKTAEKLQINLARY